MLNRAYTDGGCRDGNGSWAYVVLNDNDEVIRYNAGFDVDTTNNRMEMVAIIKAIESFPPGSEIEIYTDSGYVQKGYHNPAYMEKWLKNGWKTSKKQPVENQDLWQVILSLSVLRKFTLHLVGGHGKDPSAYNNKYNGIVDKMCTCVINNGYDGLHNIVEPFMPNKEDGYENLRLYQEV